MNQRRLFVLSFEVVNYNVMGDEFPSHRRPIAASGDQATLRRLATERVHPRAIGRRATLFDRWRQVDEDQRVDEWGDLWRLNIPHQGGRYVLEEVEAH